MPIHALITNRKEDAYSVKNAIDYLPLGLVQKTYHPQMLRLESTENITLAYRTLGQLS